MDPEITKRNLEYVKEQLKPYELEDQLNRALTKLGKYTGLITEDLSKSKTQKGVKGLEKMFKQMVVAGPKAWVFEKLIQLFEPFISILELFNPLIEVLSGIFEMALIPLIEELNPLILLLVDFLLQNKDIIIDLIQIALIPLITIIKFLTQAFVQNEDVINELMDALRPLIAELSMLVEELFETEEIMWLFKAGITVLRIEIQALIFVIHAIRDAITAVKGAFEGLKSILETIKELTSSISLGGGGGGGGNGGADLVDPLHLFHAKGGIFNRPTLGVIGEAGPEAVVPLDQYEGGNLEQTEYMRQTVFYTRRLVEIKEANRRTI